MLSVVIMTQDGIAFTFQHTGALEGTTGGIPPTRDDDYTQGGNNPEIVNEWGGIPYASIRATLRGSDQLEAGLEGELNALTKELQTELNQTIVKAVIALIAG